MKIIHINSNIEIMIAKTFSCSSNEAILSFNFESKESSVNVICDTQPS